MRSAATLEAMVKGLIPYAPARYDVLALDDEEAAWFAAYLKGKRNVKHIGIARGKPGDELPHRTPWSGTD